MMETREAVSTGRALPKGLAFGLGGGGTPGIKGRGTHMGGRLYTRTGLARTIRVPYILWMSNKIPRDVQCNVKNGLLVTYIVI
jgi:hypothetical protein